jgi:hypothetical protein
MRQADCLWRVDWLTYEALAGILGMAQNKLPRPNADEIELHPDAWERFTEFVKRIAKAGPQHRTKKSAEKAPAKTRGRGRSSS